MERKEKERKTLYGMGWLLLLMGILYLAVSRMTGIGIGDVLLPCLFHAVTGLYCPGCGGTRAAALLLQGNLPGSLYYHPLVLYGAALYLWYMVSNTVEYASRGRVRIGMRYRKGYTVAAVVILAVNFLIKNGAMLIWHYPMIG